MCIQVTYTLNNSVLYLYASSLLDTSTNNTNITSNTNDNNGNDHTNKDNNKNDNVLILYKQAMLYLYASPLPEVVLYHIILYGVTVSFHNFKSQNLKLSVSNPKSKYVAYLFVLSQISNYQGLGRKNKHDILKTDSIVSS